jgi:dUTP pyrophosphatase
VFVIKKSVKIQNIPVPAKLVRKPMNIKIIDKAISTTVPSFQNLGDAGLDLTATSISFTDDYVEYGTNLAFEIPDGCVGLLFPRSSISKYDLTLCNSVGVIDSGYRGEVKLRFKTTYNYNPSKMYRVGDRVGQLILVPFITPTINIVSDLSETKRGSGGFGSSGV